MIDESAPVTGRHLAAVSSWLKQVFQLAAGRFRVESDQAPHPFMGLSISDGEVDRLLLSTSEPAGALGDSASSLWTEESAHAHAHPGSRINLLVERFALSEVERRILLIALAPELDLRFQTLIAYLQDDVTRKLPSIDLALKLVAGTREEYWQGRTAWFRESPLIHHRLLVVHEEPARPQLAHALSVAPRIRGFLLGSDALDDALLDFATLVEPTPGPSELDLPPEDLERLWRCGPFLEEGGALVLRGPHGIGKLRIAQSLCGEWQRRLIVCDLRERTEADPELGRWLRRECQLLGAALYLKLGSAAPESRRLYAQLGRQLSAPPFPVFLSLEGDQEGEPDLHASPCFRFAFRVPDVAARRAMWLREIPPHSPARLDAEVDVLAAEYRFTPGRIREVIKEAGSIARSSPTRVMSGATVRQAVRHLCASAISNLAQRLELPFTWDDLVLPAKVLQQIREIESTVRYLPVVYGAWGFGEKSGAHSGISVLFSGGSGCGKTMTAGIVARSLGLELYLIDLSRVVSKYIGETEQNLRRVFEQAEETHAVLFFDEADALFGRRSEVKDAHDRYANIEVAYLLQRMEQFSGLAILATNLSRNLDSAFIRRIQHVVEFPFPDAQHRESIWRRQFPAAAPMAEDVDFRFLARQFDLSGGNIRNAALAGAFLAAERKQPISMEHLVQAVGRELQKMGKLPSKSEFQSHFEVLSRLNGD